MMNCFRLDLPSSSSSSAEKSASSSVTNLGPTVAEPPHPAQSPTPEQSFHQRDESDSGPTLHSASKRVRAEKEVKVLVTYFKALVAQPRLRTARIAAVSGIAGSETERKQALDMFMQRYDEVAQEEHELAAQKAELADTSEREQHSAPRTKRPRPSRNEVLAATISSSTDAITTAFNSSMSLLAAALQPTGNTDTSDSKSFDRIAELEEKIHDVDKKVTELSNKVIEAYSSIHDDIKKLMGQ
ncbi:hypothetical protein V1517DRAFT_346491 [Lipomyces orientalis]|uniref:Uncharacterized protein n=1 Tax=Lipomyces orientalis TaxID=1233043 RepID=A0ACC3TMU3_9ASCO